MHYLNVQFVWCICLKYLADHVYIVLKIYRRKLSSIRLRVQYNVWPLIVFVHVLVLLLHSSISILPIPFIFSLSSLKISCISATPDLQHRQTLRYYFQMQPTAEQLGLEFFAIITQFQWRRVAIIEQNENLFTVVSCLQCLLEYVMQLWSQLCSAILVLRLLTSICVCVWCQWRGRHLDMRIRWWGMEDQCCIKDCSFHFPSHEDLLMMTCH